MHPTLSPAASQPLSLLRKGARAVVAGMAGAAGDEERAVQLRLRELGFVPGETVRVVAVSFPGADPIAVRVGATTFALRRFEAAMVQVIPS
ncbi:ferrous iron transport protein A|uniref:FeoA family protein n=1 Tax=Noviherbaspirillum sp. L7-7A TaxID=2850560 RepID=UPI001C2C7EF4|nr:FeoA family protein [Noviherbaspirillum sp. L7-7A]MBV0880426.1 ferrous iron transport protein A [Noviherbaspirillum sp. L7-7A]